MKNFDKFKYPADHNFIYYDIDFEYVKDSEYNLSFSIFYRVVCTKCSLYIRHEENSSFGYTDMFHCWIPNKILFTETDKLKFDYTKIYSCSEMMIKKLLE